MGGFGVDPFDLLVKIILFLPPLVLFPRDSLAKLNLCKCKTSISLYTHAIPIWSSPTETRGCKSYLKINTFFILCFLIENHFVSPCCYKHLCESMMWWYLDVCEPKICFDDEMDGYEGKMIPQRRFPTCSEQLSLVMFLFLRILTETWDPTDPQNLILVLSSQMTQSLCYHNDTILREHIP